MLRPVPHSTKRSKRTPQSKRFNNTITTRRLTTTKSLQKLHNHHKNDKIYSQSLSILVTNHIDTPLNITQHSTPTLASTTPPLTHSSTRTITTTISKPHLTHNNVTTTKNQDNNNNTNNNNIKTTLYSSYPLITNTIQRRSVFIPPPSKVVNYHPQLQFSDQTIILGDHATIYNWAKTFTSTYTTPIVDTVATMLPPAPEYAPFVTPNMRASVSDYIGYHTIALGIHSDAAKFYNTSHQHRSALPTPLTSNPNSSTLSHDDDTTTTKNNNNTNNSDTTKHSSLIYDTSVSNRNVERNAPNKFVRPHFHHFWNFVQEPLLPYTMTFTHKGKYTFNYPPNTSKLIIKTIPYSITEDYPRFYSNYPTHRNNNLQIPYFIIPQITVGEYYSPLVNIIPSPFDDAHLEDTNDPKRKHIHKFIAKERKNFVEIDGVLSKKQFEHNISTLEYLIDGAYPDKVPPKHAFTHESEQVLFPSTENRPGLVPEDKLDKTNKAKNKQQNGQTDYSNNSNQNGSYDHSIIQKTLPSGYRPDSYPGFPHLPFQPTSKPVHFNPKFDQNNNNNNNDSINPTVKHMTNITVESNDQQQDSHIIKPLADVLNSSQSPMKKAESMFIEDVNNKQKKDSIEQELPGTPRDHRLEPWHNPKRSYIHDYDDLYHSTPETPNETLVRQVITQSTRFKQHSYDMFRVEILPQLLRNQVYSPLSSNTTGYAASALNYPLERSMKINIKKEDVDFIHTAQFPSQYQDLYNPVMGNNYSSSYPRPGATLIPSDLIINSVLKVLESNIVQRDLLPPQLLDFIGPEYSDDIVGHFDKLQTSFGDKTKNNNNNKTFNTNTSIGNKQNDSNTTTSNDVLYKYSLPFYLFNLDHPYKPSHCGSIFQQLREFTYQHYNPLIVQFGDQGQNNNNKTSSSLSFLDRNTQTNTSSTDPITFVSNDNIDLDVYLFSNTTPRHDPYLHTQWYTNITKRIKQSENILNQYAHLPISTFNLVNSHFTPSNVRKIHTQRIENDGGNANGIYPLYLQQYDNQENHTGKTAPTTTTPTKSSQQQDNFLTINDFVRHPAHPGIIHGVVVHPQNRQIITTFSSLYTTPYDPSFYGYNGYTSQLLIYEIMRASFGYQHDPNGGLGSIAQKDGKVVPLASNSHNLSFFSKFFTSQHKLSSDTLNDFYPALPLSYNESFKTPTPM